MSRAAVDSIHISQIHEHGGLPGIRDENVLESALARPRQARHYGDADMATLAAAYAFGLVRNHPYRDGNQRVGFLALVTFLGMNDVDFDARDVDVVTEMLSLAAGHVSETQLADWIRARTARRARRRRS